MTKPDLSAASGKGSKIFKEFREFAVKGNVVDLAVGLVVGAAFTKIVTSFVSDILMPPIGLLLGKVDFSNLFLNLSSQHYHTIAEAKAAGAATFNYGLFINEVINFLIVAVAVFFLVKQINRLRRTEAPPTTKDCPYCKSSIPSAALRCPHCTSDLQAAR